VIAKGLLGLVNTVFIWYRPDGPDTPDAIADKFSELATRGLLVEPRPRRHARQ
jgi:tetracycline repressor-like protein